MANTQFDPRVEIAGVNLFKGEFTSVGLTQSPALPHHINNRAINPKESFKILVNWQVTGAEVPLRMNAVTDWNVYAYVESIGPGPEIVLKAAPDVVARGALATTMSWSHAITVPANTLPEHGSTASGVYKVCVVVFANSSLPGVGDDVIGFTEIMTLLAEDPT